jgi:exopolysaccharide biosynthesis polyprenyl glycosylphosphotransferase
MTHTDQAREFSDDRVVAAGDAAPAARPHWGTWRASMPTAVITTADLAALAAAVAAVGQISLAVVGYVAAVVALLSVNGSRRPRISLRLSDQVGRILTAIALPVPLLLPWLPGPQAWRLAAWSAACVLAVRMLAYASIQTARRRGVLVEPVLIVGAGETGRLVAGILEEHPELGLKPAGFLDSCPAPGADLPQAVLGSAADLPRLLAQLGIRRVIVSCPAESDAGLVSALRSSRPLGAEIAVVPCLHEVGLAVPRACLDEIRGIPLIQLRRPVPASRLLKRAADLFGATVLLCLLGPVLLVLAAVIRIRCGPPAVFRQLRMTGQGRAAQVLKLRTLAEHSDSDTRWAVPTDLAIGPGRWLRASHLDELPQLLNVLRGSMSLVGPRPERPYFAEQFDRSIRGYRDRHRVRAGLTGWAQVHGLHGDTPLADRVRLDNQYIEYWTPWLDAVIVVRTVVCALRALIRVTSRQVHRP